MKKHWIFTAASILGLLMLHTRSFSQAQFEKASIENKPANFVHDANEFNHYIYGKSEPVRPKALRDFSRRFKMTMDVTWFEAADGYRAKFENDGLETWVDYDKKGNWTHTIRIYGEKKLPPDVRHVVKSSYYDYTINSVYEIELLSTPINSHCYIIHLENENSFLDLRLYDGEMETIHEWTKK